MNKNMFSLNKNYKKGVNGHIFKLNFYFSKLYQKEITYSLGWIVIIYQNFVLMRKFLWAKEK